MPYLQLRDSDGEVSNHELARAKALSIGSHISSHICIDEDEVNSLHCRVHWNKEQFEIVAETNDGVDVNGTIVVQSILRDGSIVRIGSVDLTFIEQDAAVEMAEKKKKKKFDSDDEIGLAPIEDDDGLYSLSPTQSQEIDLNNDANDDFFDEDMDADDLDDDDSVEMLIAQENKPSKKQEKPKAKPKKAEKKMSKKKDWADEVDDWLTEDDEDDVEDYDEQEVAKQPMLSRRRGAGEESPPEEPARPERKEPRRGRGDAAAEDEGGDAEEKEGAVSKLKAKMRERARRPGEQDVVRSPVVLTLVGGASVLLLLGGIFYFMIGRDFVTKRITAADAEMGSGKYAQAITILDKFIEDYPTHARTDEAKIKRGRCLIDREIKGSTPDWKAGLSEVQTFIEQHRDREAFKEETITLANYARDITMGSLETAIVVKDAELLDVSDSAKTIIERYSDPEDPQTEYFRQVQEKYQEAQAAILKQGTFNDAVAKIEGFITDNETMQALDGLRKLLVRYPALKGDKTLVELLEKILEAEKKLVTRDETVREAETTDRSTALPPPVSLTLHTRSRTSEKSAGRTVIVLGGGCCFGVDSVTGDLKWRREIGLDTPFFPISVETVVAGVLLFNNTFNELELIERHTGKLVWRQPLGAEIAGPPLVTVDQIFQPTVGGELFRLDLQSGRVSTALKFPQKLLSPPVEIAADNRMIVCGEREVIYTLSMKPLECTAVSDFDHQPGSIEAPLMRMGRLVLMCVNDKADSSLLRVLDTANADEKLFEAASARVEGVVRDTPVLRGKELFVPSSGERLAAFTVSDDPNQRVLTTIATNPGREAETANVHMLAGQDGQLWIASTELRKFRLDADSIHLEPTQNVAVGFSSQPLQSIGQDLFVGRRSRGTGGIVFSQTHRDEMSSKWKVVVGASILACSVTENAAVCLTAMGDVFNVTNTSMENGGFVEQPSLQLSLPEGLTGPLKATRLQDGRIAAYCGAPLPKLFILTDAGLMQREVPLPAPLETAPIALSNGVVLPLPGKLAFSPKPGSPAIEELPAPVEKDQVRKWVFLENVGNDQAVAMDSTGKLMKFQVRTDGVAHLREVNSLELSDPVDYRVASHGGKIFLGDASGKFRVFDGNTLEQLGEADLPAPISNDVWIAGDKVFVESGRQHLVCFSTDSNLNELWKLELGGVRLGDAPVLMGENLVIAKMDGSVISVNAASGATTKEVTLGHPISFGPRVGKDGKLLVGSVDGSVYRVESVLQETAQ